jgi:hypothetical protein
MILNWMENLSNDERPPEYLWEDDKGLELWWATVEAKREDGASISRGPQDADEDDSGTPRQMENDHARYLKEAMA